MEDIKLEIEVKNSPVPISIKQTEKILFQMKNCVCKIYTNKGSSVTGFFCKIPFPDEHNLLHVLLTNNHILNKNEIKDNNNIYFSIGDNIEKKIYI